MASVVDICNLALSWLGANLIVSLDDESTEASVCKANYPLARDAVLEAADWSFALKRQVLPKLVEEPAFGDSLSAFQLPSDCLRVISCSDDETDVRRIAWKVEDRKILCNNGNVYIRYITRVTDPTKFSPLFVHALAARLAADMAIPIVESRELQAQNWQLYQAKMREAIANDSLQGKHDWIRSDTLTRCRWSSAFVKYGAY